VLEPGIIDARAGEAQLLEAVSLREMFQPNPGDLRVVEVQFPESCQIFDVSKPGVRDLGAPEVQDTKACEAFDVSEPGVVTAADSSRFKLFKLGELSDVGQISGRKSRGRWRPW